jgi:putative ABC transport system permease protein
VIGIAGIGVIMVRAVRERRRQIGLLRSLGFAAHRVANAFAIEAGFVAMEGVIVGALLAFVCAWSVTLSSDFGEGLTFSIPPIALVTLVGGTLIGALAATFGPARSASRIRPAVALRITD